MDQPITCDLRYVLTSELRIRLQKVEPKKCDRDGRGLQELLPVLNCVFLSTKQTTISNLEIVVLIFSKNFTACNPSLEKGIEKPYLKLEFFIINNSE